MPVWDPVAELDVSVAVIDCVPAVLRVAVKEPRPLASDWPLAGSPLPGWAEASLELKFTVSAKFVSVLP